MSMVIIPGQPEDRDEGELEATTTKRGNGKTIEEMQERVKKIDVQSQVKRAVAQAELEAQARAAQQTLALQIAERKIRQQDAILATYEKQEGKRAPQQQIDTRLVLGILVGLAAFTFIVNAILTADGTIGAAAAAQFAVDWFGYVLFGAFEVAILAFMLMYYVLGSRIDIVTGKRKKAVRWFVAMLGMAFLTVGLSIYHVLDLYDYDWTNIDMWVGIGIRMAVSIAFVVVAKGIASVVFAKALDLNDLAKVGS